jgi:hypothetical protein
MMDLDGKTERYTLTFFVVYFLLIPDMIAQRKLLTIVENVFILYYHLSNPNVLMNAL